MPHVRERQPFPDEPTDPSAEATDQPAPPPETDKKGRKKDDEADTEEA